MDATAWTVIGIGVTILIAIGASFQSLRKGNEKLRDRIEAQGKETAEQLAQLRERMAKLEGLLEGLREAITGKRAA
jgi:uncharacterized membrane-anchored protein YhcB (DUF1043 family)